MRKLKKEKNADSLLTNNSLRFVRRRMNALRVEQLEIREGEDPKIPERYSLTTDLKVQCFYCKEMVDVPHNWLVDNKLNKVVGVWTREGKKFEGWSSPWGEWYNRFHPHVGSDRQLCMGNFVSSPGHRALAALQWGMNPSSDFFRCREWLWVIGHRCKEMGEPVCERHGFDAYLIPGSDNNLFSEKERCSRCEIGERVWKGEIRESPCCDDHIQSTNLPYLFICGYCDAAFTYGCRFFSQQPKQMSPYEKRVIKLLEIHDRFVEEIEEGAVDLSNPFRFVKAVREAILTAKDFNWREIPPGIEEIQKIERIDGDIAFYRTEGQEEEIKKNISNCLIELFMGEITLN